MNQNSNTPKGDKPLLPVMLRRYGIFRVTIAVTLLAVLASVISTATILYLTEGWVSPTGVLISIVIPLILAPLSSYHNHKLVHHLDMAEERLRLLSNTDELTGTFNRRYFFQQAAKEFERAKRYDHHFSIAILDFDNFKHVNDEHSHLAGDEAMKRIAQICQSGLRQIDVFARYGGDEFIFLFPDTNAREAQECLNRILARIGALHFQYAGRAITIRASIGVAEFQKNMSDLNDILREADFALYVAKHKGGMQVITHHT